jgi:hypothetical protein
MNSVELAWFLLLACDLAVALLAAFLVRKCPSYFVSSIIIALAISVIFSPGVVFSHGGFGIVPAVLAIVVQPETGRTSALSILVVFCLAFVIAYGVQLRRAHRRAQSTAVLRRMR